MSRWLKYMFLTTVFSALLLLSAGVLAAPYNLSIQSSKVGTGLYNVTFNWSLTDTSATWQSIEEIDANGSWVTRQTVGSSTVTSTLLVDETAGAKSHVYRVTAYTTGSISLGSTSTVVFRSSDMAVPYALVTKALDANRVQLDWANTPTRIYATEIIRRSISESNWTVVGRADSGGTTFTDTTAQPNTYYYYHARYILDGGVLGSDATNSGDTPVLTLLPSSGKPGLSMTGNNGITLTWGDPWTYAVYIEIARKSGNGDFVTLTTLTTDNLSTWTDYTGISDARYTYRVRAKLPSASNYSVWAETDSVLNRRLAAPGGISFVTTADGVRLTWSDNASMETGYEIWRRKSTESVSVKYANLPADATTFTDTSVSSGITYLYKVRAAQDYTQLFSDFTGESLYTVPAQTSSETMELRGSVNINDVVSLNWSLPYTNIANVYLETSQDGSEWTPLIYLSYSATTQTLSWPYGKQQMCYRIRLIDIYGKTWVSNVLTLYQTALPAAPRMAAHEVSYNVVRLDVFPANTNYTTCEIESTAANGTFSRIVNLNAPETHWLDAAVRPNTLVSYRARLVSAKGNSEWSDVVTVSLPPKAFIPNDALGHWAFFAMNGLYGIGALEKQADETIRPDAAMTRGDLVTLLVRTLGLKATATGAFYDVHSDNPHWQEIMTAKTLGITTGYQGFFYPDDAVSRQDACVLIAKALNAAGIQLSAAAPETLLRFYDAPDISPYARESLAALAASGTLRGYEDGTFRPWNFISRAEASTVVWNLLTSK